MHDYQFRDILTRQQLAQFLKNPEIIRAFENLSVDIGEILPANEAEILHIAQTALMLAAQALMFADREPEEQVVVPGPRGADGQDGQDGQDGKLLVWFEDGVSGEDGAPGPRGLPGIDGGGGSSIDDALALQALL